MMPTEPARTFHPPTIVAENKSPKRRQRRRKHGICENTILVEENGVEYHREGLILQHYRTFGHSHSLDIILEQQDEDDDDDVKAKPDRNFHHYLKQSLSPKYLSTNLKRAQTFSCLSELAGHENRPTSTTVASTTTVASSSSTGTTTSSLHCSVKATTGTKTK